MSTLKTAALAVWRALECCWDSIRLAVDLITLGPWRARRRRAALMDLVGQLDEAGPRESADRLARAVRGST